MLYYVISLLSQIYCDGPILRAVQDARLYPDSKYFVDMPLKHDPVTTLRDFYELGEKGNELIESYPDDWVPFPHSFQHIEDYRLRRWALHLHRIWRDLCRRVKEDVRIHQERYSLLYVPHPFIIPGGRFREFYYWDTFWIIKGLLFSEMFDTAKGAILNMAYMVDHHGFVPNGGRIYYLSRSQPPLLTPMVYEYFLSTGDLEFVHELMPLLEKEHNFWLLHRARSYLDPETKEELFQFFQYRATMKFPRPESYREDVELVKGMETDAERELMWSNVASAAETGWDFSTRWFAQEGPVMHDMKSIRTWSIVPVDLNAFMCMNMRILASFYEISGDFKKSQEYQARYEKMKISMKELHWNETDGIWYDYDLERKVHSNTYYVSNALPLYAKCYGDEDEVTPMRVYEYLKREGVLNFTKGIPTSLAMGSIQQWDKENAWPPMVHMVIEGFRTSGDIKLMKAAEQMATQWLIVNYKAYSTTYAMFEKYNASLFSEEFGAGGGGEYEVQKGFGWTNGVILDLLDKYGSKITVSAASSLFGSSIIALSLFSLLHLCFMYYPSL
ncbi:trehalase domain-containing protein [Ditylenchus destructor]|uniref:Trehalase n=1 Tax=Ditylenchus destructor TaxID=166010 RepID=A0AAD4R2A7_9BILA|nr:trehalase domain-containing protein [Ditylenchus destructor]